MIAAAREEVRALRDNHPIYRTVEKPFSPTIEPYIRSGVVSVPGRYAKTVDRLEREI
jgi:hypothetical protein